MKYVKPGIVIMLITVLCVLGYMAYSRTVTPKTAVTPVVAAAPAAGVTAAQPIPVIVTVDPLGELKDLLAEVQKLEANEHEGFDASIASNPQQLEVPVSFYDPIMMDGFKKDLELEINQPTDKKRRTVDEIVRIRLRLSSNGNRFEYAIFYFKGKEGESSLTPEGKTAVTTLRLSTTLWGPTESFALASKLKTKFREQFPDFNFTSRINDSSTAPAVAPFTTVDDE